MHDVHEFLRNLALVLGVAAAGTIIFQRLRQPVVFGYLTAGMVVGPHVPIPVVADEGMVRLLSELGVILPCSRSASSSACASCWPWALPPP